MSSFTAFDFIKSCITLKKSSVNELVLSLQLLTGKFIKTVTSIRESKATYRAKNEKVPKKKKPHKADLFNVQR